MKALLCLVCIVFLYVGSVLAQPNPDAWNRVDRWNDMWMNQTPQGFGNELPEYGGGEDPCYPGEWAPQCELPGGSGQQYFYESALWIGAIIDDGGVETPRVSVAFDGWNPDITELFWEEDGALIERSNLDTVNCFGEPIFDPRAIANHEYTYTSLTDTLTDPFWVHDDPIDGPHEPLGVKITRTTYTMMDEPCNHIYWIQYQVENIGDNILRDIYLGHFGYTGAGSVTEEPDWYWDDLVGFDSTHQVAYFCDNDGRAYDNPSGNDFDAPNVLGIIYLGPSQGRERVSFNWWESNGDYTLDYGPAWEAYADDDSLGMSWTRDYGTPMGDLHKYQLMSNGEQDFDQVRVCDHQWIIDHPQNGQAWSLSAPPANEADLCDGYLTRFLFSVGPLGSELGELRPGESFNVWFAYVGGLYLHDPDHPQPSNTDIDPSLFDFSDLFARVETAREGVCMNWAETPTRSRAPSPAVFAFELVWPNPFNAVAKSRFTLNRAARVTLTVYDILGRETARLASDVFSAGSHELLWKANGLPSGLYFVDARVDHAGRFVQKVVLLK